MQKITDDLNVRIADAALKIDLEQIKDANLKRKLKMLSMIGTLALEEDDLEEYEEVIYDMAKIYHTARVPAFRDMNKLITLEPQGGGRRRRN
jgi:hypothetical protein